MGGSTKGMDTIPVPDAPDFSALKGTSANTKAMGGYYADQMRGTASAAADGINATSKFYSDIMRGASKEAADEIKARSGWNADLMRRTSGAEADRISAFAMDRSDETAGWSRADRGRYESTFAPVEDRIASDAMGWDSESRIARETDRAAATVRSEAQIARDSAARRNAAMGVRPDSGRSAALDSRAAISEGLAAAGARNTTRDAVQAQGQQLRAGAASIGANIRGRAGAEMASSTATGMTGLTSAAGTRMGGLTSAAGTELSGLGAASDVRMGGLGAAGSMRMGGLGAAGNMRMTGLGAAADTHLGAHGAHVNTLGNVAGMETSSRNAALGHNMDVASANAAKSASTWGGLGSLAGAGISAFASNPAAFSFLSSSKEKTGRKPAKGALGAVRNMPVDTYRYKPEHGDPSQHVGPMAEDFAKATGMGDGRTINAQDAIGVALGAIRELDRKVERIAA